MLKIFQKKTVERVSDYHHVFGTPEGKRVLEDICKFCGIAKSSMASTSDQVYFKEGMRNVALRILTVLKVDPVKLVNEFNNQDREMEDSDG